MAAPKRLPRGFEKQVRARYDELEEQEVSFEHFLEAEKREFRRVAELEVAAEGARQPAAGTMTPCGNGDFELDIAGHHEWTGAHGSVPGSGDPDFSLFTPGLYAGAIDDANAHQTWVATDVDINAGISTTAPGSAHSVRIGNMVNGYGSELLEKTFVVPAPGLIRFWYALVLQDPGHPPDQQPSFWVRVKDSLGTVIPNLVDFGGTMDKVVADSANPFFKTGNDSNNRTIVYKDWSCAELDLTNHVGQTVTVQFVVEDCARGGHYGYAYVDNFCGSCLGDLEGSIEFDVAGSSQCGAGRICFDYTLPDSGAQTGSVTITLEIFQGGNLVDTMVSPVLTSGSNYCFDVDPSTIGGLDPNLKTFEFVGKAAFEIGGETLPPKQTDPGEYEISCGVFSYAVKFVCGVQDACSCGCGPVVPGRYATEINIYNHNDQKASITKHVVPIVIAGAAAGREPGTVRRGKADSIDLPPRTATMDDCCRLSELIFGAEPDGQMPLTIGYLEILSPIELNVTAVYTATGPDGQSISIDVETVEPKTGVNPTTWTAND